MFVVLDFGGVIVDSAHECMYYRQHGLSIANR
jgi:hypothetical protein